MKDFSDKIYAKLKQVPKGKVITYKDLAEAVNSKAYRAVGTCMRKNKDTKNIPCYKVVGSDGSIGSYSATGGVKKKIFLLRRDGVEVKNSKVSLKKHGARLS